MENPGSPRPKKARQMQSKIKVILIVFFDAVGIVHDEYAPQGQTVNKEFYLDSNEKITRGFSHKTTGVVGVLSLDASS
ncbi:hypothetical protein TNCV_1274911 [Trichonephila clavipes]|nr:hypothetical protein TNCV_1274911 [Trichonephila clavipes]